MKKLRISSGINLHSYPKTDIHAYIRQGLVFLKQIGFDAADFPLSNPMMMEGQWETRMDQVAEDMEELGIRFEVCHLPFGVKIGGTPEEIALFNQRVHLGIEAAKRLGVDYAVVHPNTETLPRLMFARKAQYDSVMAHLEPFIEHANRIGVKIVVENMRPVPQIYPYHRYCAEPDELCEIADGLGAGICWDFGHGHINGLKQSEALTYIGSRLRVLHVNDNFAWGDDHVPPFVGTIDWADAMAGLRAVGFDGLLNYEIGTSRIPSCAREYFAKYLLSAAQQLCQML